VLIAFLKCKSPECVISCGVCIHAREEVTGLGFQKMAPAPRPEMSGANWTDETGAEEADTLAKRARALNTQNDTLGH
jgi:hypothetical protein